MRKNRKKALCTAAGLAAGAGLTVVSPLAAVVVGTAFFFKGARRYAQTSDVNDARDMITGFSDASLSEDR